MIDRLREHHREAAERDLIGVEAHIFHVENLLFRLLKKRHEIADELAELAAADRDR
jgi:hypothetical protein